MLPPKNPLIHKLLCTHPNTKEILGTAKAWDPKEDRNYLLNYLPLIEPSAEQLSALKQFPKLDKNNFSMPGLTTAVALYLGAPAIQNHQVALGLCQLWGH